MSWIDKGMFSLPPVHSYTLNERKSKDFRFKKKHVSKKKKKSGVGEVKFAGRKLKSYSKKELMEFLETFIKVDPFK